MNNTIQLPSNYRISVKALIKHKNSRILLVRESEEHGWEFPGGGLDHGEELTRCLRRELSEELGVGVK